MSYNENRAVPKFLPIPLAALSSTHTDTYINTQTQIETSKHPAELQWRQQRRHGIRAASPPVAVPAHFLSALLSRSLAHSLFVCLCLTLQVFCSILWATDAACGPSTLLASPMSFSAAPRRVVAQLVGM